MTRFTHKHMTPTQMGMMVRKWSNLHTLDANNVKTDDRRGGCCGGACSNKMDHIYNNTDNTVRNCAVMCLLYATLRGKSPCSPFMYKGTFTLKYIHELLSNETSIRAHLSVVWSDIIPSETVDDIFTHFKMCSHTIV